MHRLLSVSNMTTVGQFASGPMKPNQPVSYKTVRTFGSQSCLRPYRARRSTGAHLVKLAPALPPVNLPRSVRVVSQSAFRKYVRGASYAAGAGGGFRAVTKKNIVSQFSQGAKSGIINAITISQDKSHYQEKLVTSLPPKESQVSKNNCIVEGGDTDSEILKEKSIEEGGDTDSDLQLHPLLFQPPEDGRLPYYSLNSSTSSSSSYGFLSGNQPQLHLSLSHTSHQGNEVDGFVRSQKNSNVISRGIDFHPLMQRTDYGNNVTVTTCSTTPLSDGSAGNCNRVRHSSDSLQTELQVNTDPDPTGTIAANELDLEIHLSSTSIKETDLNGTDLNQHSLFKARNAGRPFYKHDENSGANRGEFVSVGDRVVIPSNNISRYNPEERDDQSQPDIEMEHEELSDSAEESEENVEFECEEMADSEGEEDGSACEQISEMQNKDVSSYATKRLAMAERDDNIQIHRIPSLELGLSNQGMDDASNCSWFSLDTYRAEREESEDVAVKELASSRPVRSCKKPRPRSRENAKKNAVDMAQQLSLGPLAPLPARKPRKHVCRPNLNIALTVENYNSDS